METTKQFSVNFHTLFRISSTYTDLFRISWLCIVLNIIAIPLTIINYWTHTHVHWQSLQTTENYHNSSDNHYKLLNTTTILQSIIIAAEHVHNSTDNHCKLLNTTAIRPTITIAYDFTVNHYKLLNSQTTALKISIYYWKLLQFNRQSL